MTKEQLYEQVKKLLNEELFESLVLYVIKDVWDIVGCSLVEQQLESNFFESEASTAHIKVYALHKAGNIPSPRLIINFHNYPLDASRFPEEQFVIVNSSPEIIFWLLDSINYDQTEWLPLCVMPLHQFIIESCSEICLYDLYNKDPFRRYFEQFDNEYTNINKHIKAIFQKCIEIATKEMNNPSITHRPYGSYLRENDKSILIGVSAATGTIDINDLNYEENYCFLDVAACQPNILEEFKEKFLNILSHC